MKTSTSFTKLLKFLLSTCSDTSRAGARTERNHTTRKVASTPTTCVILGGHQKYFIIHQKIVSTCKTKTVPSKDGNSVQTD